MKTFSKLRRSRREEAQTYRQKNQSLLTPAATIHSSKNRAITLLELLVVLAVLAVLAVIFLPALLKPQPDRALDIQCANNLKQVGLACRVWEGDHNDKYPPFVSATNGGSMEYITGTNLWRHFQVMSNEISTPKVLICPDDDDRNFATNFTWFNDSNISFFLGIDATDTNPQMILSGDRNITNGTPVKNGILTLSTNNPSRWTKEMHNKVGNVCLADGSLQQVSIAGLQTTVANTGFTTNRLQMPVLTP